MGKFYRKIQICIDRGCGKCPFGQFEVEADECEYALKHIMSFPKLGSIRVEPRRSGKTTRIIEAANKCAESGYPTYLAVPTFEMARLVRNRFPDHKFELVVVSHNCSSENLRGRAPGVVFSDEVYGDIKILAQSYGHHFSLGYVS